jgi:3-hydroxyisobutyrate dehydrogenase-like beta-hydroxyacid dehydrogenase
LVLDSGRTLDIVIIGLLHPGQMGAAIGAQLVAAGHRVLWCPAGRSERTSVRATEAGLRTVGSVAEMLAGSELVFSICPPAAAEQLAGRIATHGFTGVFVEANAINPARMTSIAERLRSGGATAVDGAIIGPPPGGDRRARVYLSGPPAAVDTVHRLLSGSQAEPRRIDDRIGSASALKMAYGSFQKISRALAAVSHALADEFGVTEHLAAEAAVLGRNALAERDVVAGVAPRAWRWEPEMREVAESLQSVGLPPELAVAGAEVFGRWTRDKDDWDLDTETALAHLRE